MLAFADMMRKQIVMPAHLMDDDEHGTTNAGRNLFTDYSDVAEAIGGGLEHGFAPLPGGVLVKLVAP